MARRQKKKESLPITTELIEYWQKQGWTYKGLDKTFKTATVSGRGRFEWTDKYGHTHKGLLYVHQDGYSSMQIENMCAINNLERKTSTQLKLACRKANTP